MRYEGSQQEAVTAFDDLAREGQEPASHLIGYFDYLNASGRPEAACVRALVDEWLADYPKTHRPEMIRRLRSRDDVLHSSSLFELMLHALLLRQGFAVLEIEPELPNRRAPDFLVEAPDGTRFYLEATLASGMDNVAAGAQRRMREALQAIDEVQSPDFFLHLHTQGRPTQPIAVRRLRKALQRFVDGLNYEQAVANHEGDLATAPIWEHREHDAHFTIRPIPKNVRCAGGRAVRGRTFPGGIIHPENAIRSAVIGKASRYGEIDLPLVIAVNALDEFATIDDAIDALFGTKAVLVREDCELRPVREPDGAWRGPASPVYTRSSAVLFVERLSAWSVAQRSLRLIVNPWARNPINDIPLGVEVREVIDGQLQTRTGQTLREIFNLPAGWPE
ncbi:hypothetical protein [Rhodobacter capsulatus]|uniref:hypothetical protein n=1 Tax=Rhodobacter capsulatus TaxID=1061 RepID=UPI004027B65E